MNQRELRMEQRVSALEAAVFGKQVNLNTASAKEIADGIEGVGPKTAAVLIESREKAPFTSVTDAANRSGAKLAVLEAANVTV